MTGQFISPVVGASDTLPIMSQNLDNWPTNKTTVSNKSKNKVDYPYPL